MEFLIDIYYLKIQTLFNREYYTLYLYGDVSLREINLIPCCIGTKKDNVRSVSFPSLFYILLIYLFFF